LAATDSTPDFKNSTPITISVPRSKACASGRVCRPPDREREAGQAGMTYFPDEPAKDRWARYAVAVLPLLYLIVALLHSANSAPWGRQVDPESAYAMNGLAWAAGYPMMKNDHPGTTTILLVGIIIKSWTFVAGRSDVIEFGLKNYDAIIYVARAAEAVILSGVLLVSGIIVRNATRSWLAAFLFQVAPFVSSEVLHFEIMLIPESLMVSCAILGMALVLKAALDEKGPTIGLGATQGLIFALGLSSKYLHAPLAVMGVSLLRNRWAFATAAVVGPFAFFIFNRVLNPLVFTGGFHLAGERGDPQGHLRRRRGRLHRLQRILAEHGCNNHGSPDYLCGVHGRSPRCSGANADQPALSRPGQPDARCGLPRVCRATGGNIEAF